MSDAKRRAAEAALELLPQGGIIGLGTGSTATLFIDGVGRLVKEGRKLVGVPTSAQSHAQAERLGIPLLDPNGPWDIVMTVDGADEVSAELDLIKGGGACHAREKIVAAASKQNVIVVDESKMSKQLGERWAVPVEVLDFGHAATAALLSGYGKPVLRVKDGKQVRTDSGNPIYDLNAGVIANPAELESALSLLPGVVETGLFVGRATTVLVAGDGGVRRLDRPS
ncbi:MAG TPA: ribose-5-phosphate isomerase RpiA [Polyangiaceae bacterium]|nr:ribose-5-phosphate isomerase RpiA [Polyangiaceae bacterium]HMR73894.1 ribose-5-phosphate isomerase RpiA [Polyangiaceae bacterium]